MKYFLIAIFLITSCMHTKNTQLGQNDGRLPVSNKICPISSITVLLGKNFAEVKLKLGEPYFRHDFLFPSQALAQRHLELYELLPTENKQMYEMSEWIYGFQGQRIYVFFVKNNDRWEVIHGRKFPDSEQE